jgi:choline dehydrogenase-like flavoprotein
VSPNPLLIFLNLDSFIFLEGQFSFRKLEMTDALPASVDYIIVGGGTSGLVLAARLSENPDLQIVVLEAGPDRTSDPRVSDSSVWPTLPGTDLDWQTKTVPQVHSFPTAILLPQY